MRPLRPVLRRPAALATACLVSVLALSGCIKVDADVAIASDATGTGTFAFELQNEAASFLGITDLEAFRTQLESGELSQEGGLTAFEDCVTSETETGFAYTCTFANMAFTNADDLWSIAHEDTSIVFEMRNATGEDGADSSLLGDTSMGSLTVNILFPGTITSIEGAGVEKTSDTTATYRGNLMESFAVTIRSEDGNSSTPWAVIAVVLVTLAIVVLLVIVVIVLITRRRRGASPVANDARDADSDGTPDANAIEPSPSGDQGSDGSPETT